VERDNRFNRNYNSSYRDNGGYRDNNGGYRDNNSGYRDNSYRDHNSGGYRDRDNNGSYRDNGYRNNYRENNYRDNGYRDNRNHYRDSRDRGSSEQRATGVYSKRIRAGRRRTYFFDVKTTRTSDFFLTITESKKRFDNRGYERHKLHLYKEDFNKFLEALQETVEHVKNELMPEYDFDEFSRQNDSYEYENNQYDNNYTENNYEKQDTRPKVEIESETTAEADEEDDDFDFDDDMSTSAADDDLRWD